MPFTLSGVDLSTALVVLPRFDAWTAEVSTVDPLQLAKGAKVSLVLGDLVLAGAVVSGGTWAGVSSYCIEAGAGGWSKVVPARAYRDDGGIMLGKVAADLAAEVGEKLVVDAGDRPLGYACERVGGVASASLHALAGSSWYVAADGVTHLGARPVAPVPAGLTFVVESLDPVRRRAVLSTPDDLLAALATPGATWSADGVDGLFTVNGATVIVSASSVRVEVSESVPGAEQMARIVDHLTHARRLLGYYLYEAREDVAADPHSGSPPPLGSCSLICLEAFDGLPARILPDAVYVPKAHGLPGASSVLAAGTQVLLGFAGGSPGRPFVAFYLSGQPRPAAVGFDATAIVLGDVNVAHDAAHGDVSDSNFVTLKNAVNTALLTLGQAPIAALPSVSSPKVKIE